MPNPLFIQRIVGLQNEIKMNNKEYIRYSREMKSLTDKLLKSKEKSVEFYKSAGIHTKTGKLSRVYSQPKVLQSKV